MKYPSLFSSSFIGPFNIYVDYNDVVDDTQLENKRWDVSVLSIFNRVIMNWHPIFRVVDAGSIRKYNKNE